MGIIKADKLVHEFIRRDEEGNVEGITRAVDEVNLDIKQGDFVAILGHNGSGKSTLLRCATGLEAPDSGEIIKQGDVGLVFQNFNLFPHFSVLKNITEAQRVVLGKEKSEASCLCNGRHHR